MALKRSHWPDGELVTVEHTSRVLADNPLGDPNVRPASTTAWTAACHSSAAG